MKKFMAILMLATGMLISPIFVFTQETGGNSEEINQLNQAIAQKKERIAQLEKSIEEYKEKIKQKRLEAVSLSNQMAIIDNRLAQIELDIKATAEKLASLDLELEALNLTIVDKEKSIAKQKDILAELIRTIYYRDGKSYIEIAAAYDNFSNFYNQLQYLRKIDSDLSKNVRALKLAKTELESKKGQTEERKTAYDDLKKQLEEKKQNWEEEGDLKHNLLAQAQSSELKFNALLSNLRAQYQQIEGEIEGIEQEVRKKLENQKKFEKIEGEGVVFSWPTQSQYVTAYFHDPDYPYRYVFEHNGVDIRAAQGTAVKAAGSGYVARTKYCSLSSCYSYVMLIHADGLATVYGHLSGIVVKEDQFVTRGDVIGYSGGMPGTAGAGPFVTGPHLHFEVRLNGIPVDPLKYLN